MFCVECDINVCIIIIYHLHKPNLKYNMPKFVEVIENNTTDLKKYLNLFGSSWWDFQTTHSVTLKTMGRILIAKRV